MTATLPHPGHKIIRKWGPCWPAAPFIICPSPAIHQSITHHSSPSSTNRKTDSTIRRENERGTAAQDHIPALRTTLPGTTVPAPRRPPTAAKTAPTARSRSQSPRAASPSSSKRYGKRADSGGKRPIRICWSEAVKCPWTRRAALDLRCGAGPWIAPPPGSATSLRTAVGPSPWTGAQHARIKIGPLSEAIRAPPRTCCARSPLQKGIWGPKKSHKLPAGTTTKRATLRPPLSDPTNPRPTLSLTLTHLNAA